MENLADDSNTADETNLESQESGGESVQVEAHEQESDSGFSSLIARAGESLRENVLVDDQSPKKKSGKAAATTREDFSLLVVSIVTLGVTFWNIPAETKPNPDEINMLAHHLSGILVRHLNINTKLSADAIDIIGIFAVVTGWQARVRVFIVQTQTTPVIGATYPKNGNVSQVQDPTAALDPALGDVMNRVRGQYLNRNGDS